MKTFPIVQMHLKGIITIISIFIFIFLLLQNDCNNYFDGNVETKCNKEKGGLNILLKKSLLPY